MGTKSELKPGDTVYVATRVTSPANACLEDLSAVSGAPLYGEDWIFDAGAVKAIKGRTVHVAGGGRHSADHVLSKEVGKAALVAYAAWTEARAAEAARTKAVIDRFAGVGLLASMVGGTLSIRRRDSESDVLGWAEGIASAIERHRAVVALEAGVPAADGPPVVHLYLSLQQAAIAVEALRDASDPRLEDLAAARSRLAVSASDPRLEAACSQIAVNGSKAEVPFDLMEVLAQDARAWVRERIARHTDLPANLMAVLAQDNRVPVRVAITQRRGLSADLIAVLARDKSDWVRECIAERDDLPVDLMAVLARDEAVYVRETLAQRPHLPADLITALAQDDRERVRIAITKRSALTAET